MPPPLTVGACLSLTGRYARFGRQAGAGLEAWRTLDGEAELVLVDDRSDPAHTAACVASLAARCDLLLGPYSTQLARAAAGAAGRALIWNHGGSGDDVQAGGAGRMVSVLTPAGRYAEPFVRRLAGSAAAPLAIVRGRGSFGRQVADGAEAFARRLGLEVIRFDAGAPPPPGCDLLSAGAFEDDVAVVARALALRRPPRSVCSVAAGVREFGQAVPSPEGVFGLAQWFPGSAASVGLGPGEAEFVDAYTALTGTVPDYPAVQAAAAAVLATHCAALAGSVAPDPLWATAAGLDTTTLFGRFRIDAATGAQAAHETVLVRWTAGRLHFAP